MTPIEAGRLGHELLSFFLVFSFSACNASADCSLCEFSLIAYPVLHRGSCVFSLSSYSCLFSYALISYLNIEYDCYAMTGSFDSYSIRDDAFYLFYAITYSGA